MTTYASFRSGRAVGLALRLALVLVLVLSCSLELAMGRVGATGGGLAAGRAHGGLSPPAGLSAGEWAGIVAQILESDPQSSLFSSQVAKLASYDLVAGDGFGRAVAVSGDTVVVGVPEDDDFGINCGAAYIFERNQGGADQWLQVAKLTATTDAGAGDRFGDAVGISGDTVVVGAPNDDDEGSESGSAFVFERNRGGRNQWGRVRMLTAEVPSALDRFGSAVAISGDTVVVGAPFGHGGFYDSGLVYVFARNEGGVDSWGRVQSLSIGDPEESAWLGASVAICGDVVVAGAPRDDAGASDAGAAYVFERNQGGADSWGQVQKLVPTDPEEEAEFGAAVDASVDTVVVGAAHADAEHPLGYNVHDAGAAYVFERNQGGADQWGQVRRLTAPDPEWGDYLGTAVGISGDTVVAGAHWANQAGGPYDVGAVYVFERNQGGADEWGCVERLTADDAEANDHLGLAAAISGDTIVAGAPYESEAGASAGAGYVFVRQGATWRWERKPAPLGGASADRFGFSVAVSGDTAVIGAHFVDHGDCDDAGAAYVFVRNQGAMDRWGQVARLTADDPDDQHYFGQSVAISGDTIVVGAHNDDDGGNNAGAAYVFERNHGVGPDDWEQVAKLTAGDAYQGDEFGFSVGISGDTVVVGAWQDDDAGTGSGSAYVFERNQGGTADNWGQVAKLTASDAAAGDRFGKSVAISGDTVVVGADHGGGMPPGSAYVFARNEGGGADGWGEVRTLVASGAAVGDWFGHAVAISGDTVVAGAPLGNGGYGAAYVFERNCGVWADDWGQVQELTADNVAYYGYFGWSVGISVDTVVVGAYADDGAANGSGSAYVFGRNRGGADQWGQVAKLTARDAAELDYYGHGVGIDGQVLVIGAHQDDDLGAGSGSATVYRWTVARLYLPLAMR
jgi:hypothetical protein